MIKAAILGDNDANISQLVQLLHDHPDVELMAYANKDMGGQRLDDIFPQLKGETELRATSELDIDDIDVVFIVGKPGLARRFVKSTALPDRLHIIDMTGDYIGSYADGDIEFVQGIAELNRKAMVRGAKHVAVPSAITQAVALGLLPLAKNLMLNSPVNLAVVYNDPNAEPETLTPRRLEQSVTDDIRRAITALQTSFDSPVNGIAFRGDIPTGLTAVITTNNAIDLSQLRQLYEDFYDDHSFTFIVDSVPDANDVRGTNKCFIYLNKEDDKLTVTTVLDTEIKGEAGNAVHAMNLLFGLLEKVGL